jgi:hypothetical protein
VGDDSRESLALQHRLVSARRSEGTREGALLIGRMAWSLSLRIVNCGWLQFYSFFLRSDLTYFNPTYHFLFQVTSVYSTRGRFQAFCTITRRVCTIIQHEA